MFTTRSGKNEKLGVWFSCDKRVSKDSINYVMVRIKNRFYIRWIFSRLRLGVVVCLRRVVAFKFRV